MVRVERDWTEAAPEAPEATGRAWLSPDQMVARFAGPALLIAADGGVRAANAGGRLLLAAVAERLRDQVIRTLIAHVPWTTRIETAFGGERRVFDLTLLPLAGEAEDGVLILGREATLEHNLARALADSRARYRDLVSCSADFAWETDADGRFIFISPSGALGHAAEDLVDRPFTLLTGEAVLGDGESPFACHWPRSGVEVRLGGVDGAVAIVEISCLPVTDGEGAWRGARGVCRDVTREHDQQAALHRAEQRESLMRSVIDAIRNEVTPEAMFQAAAGSTAGALGAEACWVVRGTGQVVARHGERGPPPVEDGAGVLAAACAFRGESLGRLVVRRAAARGPWSAEETDFLDGVAAQLAVAMAQAGVHEKLNALSTTDELTGLLNRRGMLRALAARFRTGGMASGVLVYLDLDNFKPVNDTHGHARGDEALMALARRLEVLVRGGDLVARLGGDEFVLWLDGAGEAGGLAKARGLLAMAGELRHFSADDARPLSLSIGLAVIEEAVDGERGIEMMIGRADAAMYAAKHGGKNRIALARSDEPAREVA